MLQKRVFFLVVGVFNGKPCIAQYHACISNYTFYNLKNSLHKRESVRKSCSYDIFSIPGWTEVTKGIGTNVELLIFLNLTRLWGRVCESCDLLLCVRVFL